MNAVHDLQMMPDDASSNCEKVQNERKRVLEDNIDDCLTKGINAF